MFEDNGIADTEYVKAMFDISAPTLSKLAKTYPDAKAGRDRWNLGALERAISDRRSHPAASKTKDIALARAGSPDLAGQLVEARLAKARADAEKAAHAARRASGELVERAAVIAQAVALVTAVKARLEGLGARVAPDLVGRGQYEIADRVNREIEVALDDLARLETVTDAAAI